MQSAATAARLCKALRRKLLSIAKDLQSQPPDIREGTKYLLQGAIFLEGLGESLFLLDREVPDKAIVHKAPKRKVRRRGEPSPPVPPEQVSDQDVRSPLESDRSPAAR